MRWRLPRRAERGTPAVAAQAPVPAGQPRRPAWQVLAPIRPTIAAYPHLLAPTGLPDIASTRPMLATPRPVTGVDLVPRGIVAARALPPEPVAATPVAPRPPLADPPRWAPPVRDRAASP